MGGRAQRLSVVVVDRARGEGKRREITVFSSNFRRFLWPQLLLIALVALVVALVAGFALDDANARVGSVIWTAALAVIVACVIAGAMTWWNSLRQTKETAHLFLDAVPAALARRPALASIDDDEVLHDIARTFAELMNEATKDQAQLLTVISSMSDGLIATDHQQRILLTNDAARELMVFRSPEARGKQLWEILPIEPVLKAVTEVSLTGERKTVSIGPVSGRYLDVTVCRLPLRPAGFVIVAHDVTETMRYEELRKEFVANVSHELRTPLTVIKGYVETLKDGAVDDRARAIQYLTTVERHTEQLTNLVDDLLSLSRLDSTPGVPQPKPVHLSRVAHKVAELMHPAAAKKGHKLIVQAAEGLHPIAGNPEYLERAIANLVENAIKYTKEDGVIKLIVRGENGHIVVEVSDNGIGIPAEEIPRIFERFYRVDRSRTRDPGGTGLGLSIVKHLLELQAGRVSAGNREGGGAVFEVVLPA